MNKHSKITLVAALADNNCIGENNRIPWHVPEDFEFFKNYTMGKPVVMGRKTWESLPKKPLPGRPNYVISRQQEQQFSGAILCHNIEEAIQQLADCPEIIIMGGAQIYAQAMPLATDLRLTRIHVSVIGDTFFPAINANEWQQTESSSHISSKNNIAYDLQHFVRRWAFI
ncbi:dihydrofolate reductase [Snodgrassella communis]|uniref:Dihydrofolate reductase n=1 Tax=Snodgrassella communis TaxID=2946699 RepID=A0A066TP07_9NEIS|nr:dihydrofolate reductase [Snodgrassella communis]KDN12939.1 Dihydrofolate reductase [Snodgrassella communis]KDN15247.1 Dihydrofolate reductase [Snodgrassella communis]PIT10387.1 dihydrofolate reductase [Snodgrassella communis]PIT26861.1 dihydrofolate reductase [Snodgrassella communis]PIT29720.1 dihydrofolate reductase [Snodgrassella communis]